MPNRENPAMDDARASVVAAERLLATAPGSTSGRLDGPTSALEALSRVEGALRSARSEPASAPAARSAAADLLSDVRAAKADLLTYELARQRSMMTLVSDGLARLRSAGTIDDLVESIPIHTVALGYERAMFSWVDQEYWVPRSMHTVSGPDEARAILAAGAPPYSHVRDLLEVHVVRDRRSILVLDCESNPRVNPRIIAVSQSRTYVAAPIVARNHVAAFVHLDRNVASGVNDEFDRDLLALFCEGIGVMLDRLLVSDRPVADGLTRQPVADWVDALTAREHEVLRLMADGLTNPEISNRLFISHDTTKTHVKKLMRKLGTHTRAEAGAMYHRLRIDRATSSLS
jgi:DNA-binding CsgD family transcriptional regulator